MPFAPLVSACIELVSNHYLNLDDDSPQRLSALCGRVIAIDISPFPELFFSVSDSQLDVLQHYSGKPDSQLRLAAWSLPKLVDPNRLPELIKSDEVSLAGDIRLIQQFAALFSEVEPELEDKLAQFIGDGLAHLLFRQVYRVSASLRQFWQSGLQNATALSVEEWHLTPGKTEFSVFASDVATLQIDVDALAARLQQVCHDGN
ncbi:ubiquinone biosynthesis accessory factor UbiJ [Celerinatantimonas yamalensis]|uniref:Ubiquinone biosynthesis accessory factor UbiJ n=1 Tax=Celerinatantimonas yamalensis TaxID=559956 RepID=A0ABW9G8J2_9GAMM